MVIPLLGNYFQGFHSWGSKNCGCYFCHSSNFSFTLFCYRCVLTKFKLKVVLDEMATSQGEVAFRVATYMPIYLEILSLMKKCDTSPMHAVKTKALRVKWARIGRWAIKLNDPWVFWSVDIAIVWRKMMLPWPQQQLLTLTLTNHTCHSVFVDVAVLVFSWCHLAL